MINKIIEIKNNSHPLVGNCSGVYFLFDQNELVYVGQGWNCFLRVAEHTRKDSNKIFSTWNFVNIEDPIERKQVERELMLAVIETPPFCDMRWRPVLSHGHSYALSHLREAAGPHWRMVSRRTIPLV